MEPDSRRNAGCGEAPGGLSPACLDRVMEIWRKKAGEPMYDLFVYGTLRSGEMYHGLLGASRLVASPARVRGVLVDTGHGYPAMRDGEGEVCGEIYAVDDETLARIDELEDYYGPGDPRNLYERVTRTARTGEGDMDVLVYVSDRFAEATAIPSGDWVLHRKTGRRPGQ